MNKRIRLSSGFRGGCLRAMACLDRGNASCTWRHVISDDDRRLCRGFRLYHQLYFVTNWSLEAKESDIENRNQSASVYIRLAQCRTLWPTAPVVCAGYYRKKPPTGRMKSSVVAYWPLGFHQTVRATPTLPSVMTAVHRLYYTSPLRNMLRFLFFTF